MTDMSEPAKIRQALDSTAAGIKVALLLTVMSAGLYLWKHTSLQLQMLCLWLAVTILGMVVYRVRRRKPEGSGS
jgi:ABC-type bacteriocin/lantibiotic exporter with double-glycine peptidase domain